MKRHRRKKQINENKNNEVRSNDKSSTSMNKDENRVVALIIGILLEGLPIYIMALIQLYSFKNDFYINCSKSLLLTILVGTCMFLSQSKIESKVIVSILIVPLVFSCVLYILSETWDEARLRLYQFVIFHAFTFILLIVYIVCKAVVLTNCVVRK